MLGELPFFSHHHYRLKPLGHEFNWLIVLLYTQNNYTYTKRRQLHDKIEAQSLILIINT